MSMAHYAAEPKQYPRRTRDVKVFSKSQDERLMVRVHKANIRAESIKEHGTGKWRPQHKLTFTF